MAELIHLSNVQFLDNNGDPLSGGKLYTYTAGTSTPKTTYKDLDGLEANTNPIILDSAGRPPYDVRMINGVLKLVIKDSLDNTLKTIDDIQSFSDLINTDGALAILNNLSDLDDVDTAITNLENGATDGDLVQTTRTQTLTNKTIVVASNTVTTAASGNLSATELNAALAELQTDIDTRATEADLTTDESNLATHIADTSAHGVAGEVVGTTDSQTLTNKALTSPIIGTEATFTNQAELRLGDASTNYTGFKAPGSVGSNTIYEMPTADGSSGQVLATNGSKVLSWASPTSSVLSVATKTTTYTATTSDDVILADTSGGAWTLSLYTAVGNTGKILRIKKTTSDFSALTIDPNSTETIDGSTTYLVYLQNDEVTLVSDGSNWKIISEYFVPIHIAYNSNAGQTFTNTPSIMNFEDLVYESHSGMVATGASWAFTAKRKGIYRFTARQLYSADGTYTGGNRAFLHLYKNASIYREFARSVAWASVNLNLGINGSISVDLDYGDTVSIYASNARTGGTTLITDGTYNFINIDWISKQ